MAFCGINMAGAEKNGKGGHYHGNRKGIITPHGCLVLLDPGKIRKVEHYSICCGYGLELQGDVRHDADNRNDRYQAADQRTLAVA